MPIANIFARGTRQKRKLQRRWLIWRGTSCSCSSTDRCLPGLDAKHRQDWRHLGCIHCAQPASLPDFHLHTEPSLDGQPGKSCRCRFADQRVTFPWLCLFPLLWAIASVPGNWLILEHVILAIAHFCLHYIVGKGKVFLLDFTFILALWDKKPNNADFLFYLKAIRP